MRCGRKNYSPAFKSKVRVAALSEEGTLTEGAERFVDHTRTIDYWSGIQYHRAQDCVFRRLRPASPKEGGHLSERSDTARNIQIVDDVVAAVAQGRTPLILTEGVKHVDAVHHLLSDRHVVVAVLTGGMKSGDKYVVLKALWGTDSEKPSVLISTGRYIGEGFDYPALDTLFLAMPISWCGTLEQYAGRLHRLHAGKHEVRVCDYVDGQIPMLSRMCAKRVRSYKAMGYIVKECTGQLELPKAKEQ